MLISIYTFIIGAAHVTHSVSRTEIEIGGIKKKRRTPLRPPQPPQCRCYDIDLIFSFMELSAG